MLFLHECTPSLVGVYSCKCLSALRYSIGCTLLFNRTRTFALSGAHLYSIERGLLLNSPKTFHQKSMLDEAKVCAQLVNRARAIY